MMSRATHLALFAALTAILLVAIFCVTVIRYRRPLRDEIRQAIINRDAAVLRPVVQREILTRENDGEEEPVSLVPAVLESARQEGMLAVATFDAKGHTLGYEPQALLFPELPIDDYFRLLKGESISAYHPDFVLSRYFAGVGSDGLSHTVPVLEVIIPLHGREANHTLGFAQYYIDARNLAGELAEIDARIDRQTTATLAIGSAILLAVVGLAYAGLHRAQRDVQQRTDELVRANFDLGLAAKTSAIGQLTAHLIHGLQGSVAGLHAVVAGRRSAEGVGEDWETAADYTAQMQAMIEETVSLLGDSTGAAVYELSGYELADIVRQRCAPLAAKKGVPLSVSGGFDSKLDGHRGGLLCLIVHNLVQNAIEATAAGEEVAVIFRNGGPTMSVRVSDSGPGIPDRVRTRLFEPGRSGRPGGTGLGLAISQLLARQIGARLDLESTGPDGTVFALTLALSHENGSAN